MAHENAEIAIEQRLKANWPHSEVYTENGKEKPPASGASFISLQFPISDPRRWSVGTRHYREEGVFRIVLSVERGTGKAKLRTWGAELRALFLDRKFSGVETKVPTDPLVDDRSDAGSFFVAYVGVPYFYQWREL